MQATTVQDVQSVKENGGNILHLALGDCSNISALAKAIETSFHNNPSSRLSSIVVTDAVDAYPSLRRGRALCGLLDSIGKVESIRQVRIEQMGGVRVGVSILTVAMLSELLYQVGDRLEVLTISDTDIVMPSWPERIDDLVGAMKQLHCLRKCNLSNMVVVDDESGNAIEISSIFGAISTLPMLVEFQVDLARGTGTTLERSLNSLDGLVLDKLQTLQLDEIPISSPCLQSLSQKVGANKSLEKLYISFYSSSTSKDTSKLAFLAEALRDNTALKSVDLRLWFNQSQHLKPFLLQVAKAICQNTKSSITDLSIVARNAELSLFEDAMVESLKTNCTLTTLTLDSAYEDDIVWGAKTAEIQMYLRLNALGRKKLLRKQASRKTLVDTIARMTPTNDLDCIFYCLQMNPSLCQVASPRRDQSSASSHGRNKRGFSEGNQSDVGQKDVEEEKDSKRMRLSLEEIQHKHATEMEEIQKKHAKEKARLEEEIERLKSSK